MFASGGDFRRREHGFHRKIKRFLFWAKYLLCFYFFFFSFLVQ